MKSEGFTLIELLVVMTVASFLIVGAFYAFSTSFRIWVRLGTERDALQNARVVIERIAREIKNAERVDSSSTSSKLVVKLDGETIIYDYNDSKVRRRKGLGSSYLTTEGAIKALCFSYPHPKLVKIDLIFGRNLELSAMAYLRN